jgi:hypothetical protein
MVILAIELSSKYQMQDRIYYFVVYQNPEDL